MTCDSSIQLSFTYRNTWIVGWIIFAFAFSLVMFSIVHTIIDRENIANFGFVMFFHSVVLSILLLTLPVVLIVRGWRKIWVEDESIIVRQVFGYQRVAICDIVQVRWRVNNSLGSVVLTGRMHPITISFSGMRRSDARRLIAALHAHFTQARQVDWNIFLYQTCCRRLADRSVRKAIAREIHIWWQRFLFLFAAIATSVQGFLFVLTQHANVRLWSLAGIVVVFILAAWLQKRYSKKTRALADRYVQTHGDELPFD